jgi:hypothetical protein
MTGNPTLERLTMALTDTGARAAIRIIFQMSTDEELRSAYERAERWPGDPIRDLLAIEMERRNLEL